MKQLIKINKLISRIYMAAYTAQCQKNNPVRKWAEELNRHFSKEDIKMPREVHSSIRGARESRGLLSSHFRANETSSMLVSRT